MGEARIEIIGDGPYGLPPSQSASANAVSEAVELTFYVFLPSAGGNLVPIVLPMTHEVALTLADSLRMAAVAAELNSIDRRAKRGAP